MSHFWFQRYNDYNDCYDYSDYTDYNDYNDYNDYRDSDLDLGYEQFSEYRQSWL